jgi:hypothetical protein
MGESGEDSGEYTTNLKQIVIKTIPQKSPETWAADVF